jgi:adenylate cyclase
VGLSNKKLIAFLSILFAAIIFTYIALSYNFLESIENKSWDYRLKLTASGVGDPKIKIIVVDQASLDHYAREEGITWPWPRTLYVPVLRYLKEAGAKGVAFDILFSEGSIHGVEEDLEFSKELVGEMPIVFTVAPTLSKNVDLDPKSFNKFKERQVASRKKINFLAEDKNIVKFNSITLPVPEILETSTAFGSTWALPDSDGIFRHYREGGYVEDVPIRSLAFSLYESTQPVFDSQDFKDYLDLEGRLTVRFHGKERVYETIPIADVISSYVSVSEGSNQAPIVPLNTFKDAYVFIGVWAPGLLDLRPTALNEVYKGVEYHATVFDNILHKDFVKKTSSGFNLCFSAAFIFLIIAPIFFIKRISLQILTSVFVLIGFFGSAYYLLFLYGMWVKVVVPLLFMVVALLSALSVQYHLEGRERRFIKDAFSRYVSPKLIQQILADPKTLALGGEKRELTIFFSDLKGFTSISENMPAEKLVPLLNRFLTEMTDILLDSGATLDKYEGDAIIAFWNAPVLIPDHPYLAVKAALMCQKRLAELREEFKREYGAELHMRIGLHTGVVNVGNFGSRERFDYTVIGDAANFASRLEGVNKVFGTPILISKSTRDRLNSKIPCRKIGTIKVVGKSAGVEVYEPLLIESESISEFESCLDKFEKGHLEEALSGFKKLEADPVTMAYVQRIEREIEKGMGADWSYVWNLSEK